MAIVVLIPILRFIFFSGAIWTTTQLMWFIWWFVFPPRSMVSFHLYFCMYSIELNWRWLRKKIDDGPTRLYQRRHTITDALLWHRCQSTTHASVSVCVRSIRFCAVNGKRRTNSVEPLSNTVSITWTVIDVVVSVIRHVRCPSCARVSLSFCHVVVFFLVFLITTEYYSNSNPNYDTYHMQTMPGEQTRARIHVRGVWVYGK